MKSRHLIKAVKRISHLPLNKNLFLYSCNKIRSAALAATNSTMVAWPSNIMLELSASCNLACKTCPREYDHGNKMNKGFMDEILAMKIIDQAWPYIDSIGLTGMGETLLYKPLQNIVDYIRSKNKGIIISISTNAHVPGFRRIIELLADKVDTIQISVDGLHEIYEYIRKKATFRIFNENLNCASELCRNSKTDLMLNMVVTPENFRQMPDMIRYSVEKGIAYMDFTKFNLAAVTGFDRTYYEFYNSPEFNEILIRTKNLAAKTPGISITMNSFDNMSSNGFRSCPFPWSHFYLTWEGYLVPCCAKPFPKEMNFGNINNSNLLELLNSNEYRKFRTLWSENKTPDFCRNCHFVSA